MRVKRTEDSYTLHFVLSTMFVENNAIFPLFEPSLVPVKSNNTCMKITLPKRIYLKEKTFYSAEHSDCTTRPSGLLICLDNFRKETHPQTVPCLNNGIDCETEEVRCQPHVVQVSAGALIFRNSLPVYGISAKQSGSLIRLDKPDVETELFSWKEYTQIQVAQRVIYGIQKESASNTVNWHTEFGVPHGIPTEHGIPTTPIPTFGIPFGRNSVQVANGIPSRGHLIPSLS